MNTLLRAPAPLHEHIHVMVHSPYYRAHDRLAVSWASPRWHNRIRSTPAAAINTLMTASSTASPCPGRPPRRPRWHHRPGRRQRHHLPFKPRPPPPHGSLWQRVRAGDRAPLRALSAPLQAVIASRRSLLSAPPGVARAVPCSFSRVGVGAKGELKFESPLR